MSKLLIEFIRNAGIGALGLLFSSIVLSLFFVVIYGFVSLTLVLSGGTFDAMAASGLILIGLMCLAGIGMQITKGE